MNDDERDAWLREALRHAPDSAALPPSGVSDAILAKARAAARAPAAGSAATTAPRRAAARTASANPLAAFWAWLARPPVAAGFASVMAATLVGLMWWDRPMDETLVRAPAPVSDRVAAAAPQGAEKAAVPAPTVMAEAAPPLPLQARPMPGDASPPVTKDDERAAEAKLQAKQKSGAPAPFPALEQQRRADATAAPPPRPREAAKKEVEIDRLQADAARPAPPAAPALQQPPGARPDPTPPVASPAPVLAAAAPPPERAQRQRAAGDARDTRDTRDKDAAAFASATPEPAPMRDELRRARSEAAAPPRAGAARAPLAAVIAAIAADPERWSRQTSGGDLYALEAGWRRWLDELDAATRDRWRLAEPAGPALDLGTARVRPTTLRLVGADRAATLIRIEGAVVHVETGSGGSATRWQATLDPAAAEALQAAARKLPP